MNIYGSFIPSNILEIENIVLWTLFGVSIATLVLSFIRGYKRGWRYGTFRLVYFFLMILVAFCTLDACAGALGNINLSTWIHQPVVVNVGKEQLIVEAGPIFEMLKDGSAQYVKLVSPSLSSTELSDIVIGFSTSVLKLAMVIVDGILLATVFNLLGLILWHTLFKRIIPKEKRKSTYKKGRWVSAVEELVGASVILGMIITPLSSIGNSLTVGVNKAKIAAKDGQKANNTVATNEDLKAIQEISAAYENSAFAKTFFEWTKDNNGESYDTKLVKFFTDYKNKDTSISFLNELQVGSEITSYVFQSGLLNEEATSFGKAYLLLSKWYGPAMLNSVANSDVVKEVLPFAYELAMNMDATQKYIGKNFGYKPSDYDLDGSIKKLSQMVSDLQTSGIYDVVTDKDGKVHFDSEQVKKLTSTKSYQGFNAAFEVFEGDDEKRNLFEDIIKAYIVNKALNTTAEESTYFKMLPSAEGCDYDTDEDGGKIAKTMNSFYKNLDISKELHILYGSFYKMANLDPRVTELVLKPVVAHESMDYKLAVEIVGDNKESLYTLIAGEKEEATASSIKLSKLNAEKTEVIKDNHYLLESDLVVMAYPSIVNALCEKAEQNIEGVELDSDKLISAVFGDDATDINTGRENLKKETGCILDIAEKFNNDACKEFLADTNAMKGITFKSNGHMYSISDQLLDGFIGVFNEIGIQQDKGSELIKYFVPELGKIINAKLKESNTKFISSIDTNVDKFGCEIASLLEAYKNSKPLVNYTSQFSATLGEKGRSLSEAIVGLKPYISGANSQLQQLLYTLVDSKVLNNDNKNIEMLFTRLFSKMLNDPEYTVTIEEDPKKICDALIEMMNVAICDYPKQIEQIIANPKLLDIDTLSSISFEKLFTPIDSSKTLSGFFGKYLDKVTKEKIGINFGSGNFQDIKSWKIEGQSLDTLFKYSKQIGDLKNIDLVNSDPEIIGEIISCISTNPIFTDKDDPSKSTFGAYIYDKLTDQLDNDMLKYFANPNVDVNDPNLSKSEKTSQLYEDFARISPENWKTESKIFSRIIGDFSIIKDGANKDNELSPYVNAAASDLCDALENSKSLGRVMSYHLFNQASKYLVDTIDVLSNAQELNYLPLWNSYDSDEIGNLYIRDAEFNCLKGLVCTIFDPVYGLNTWKNSSGMIENVSGNYFIKPVLDSMVTSISFNSLPLPEVVDPTNYQLTFVEWTAAAFLYDSTAYGPKTEATLNIIKGKVKEVDPNPYIDDGQNPNRIKSDGKWANEVNSLVNTIETIRNLDFEISDKKISTSFVNDDGTPKSDEELGEIRDSFHEVIKEANDSKLLSSFVTDAVVDQAVGLIPGAEESGIDKDAIAKQDGGKFTESQLSDMADIYKDAGALGEDVKNIKSIDKSDPKRKYAEDMVEKLKNNPMFENNEFIQNFTFDS